MAVKNALRMSIQSNGGSKGTKITPKSANIAVRCLPECLYGTQLYDSPRIPR